MRDIYGRFIKGHKVIGGFKKGHKVPKKWRDITREHNTGKRYHWKGGIITHQGYRMVKMVGHPMARRSGYIMEHRLMMANYLGRILGREEVVHHKNHIKTDNRIENLELMSKREHDIGHLRKKI